MGAKNDTTKPDDGGPRPSKAIPAMVGIGASAGGLNSLLDLFQDIEPGIGFAFLIAQHLSPDHDSKLTEILARNVRLPITEAREGMAIEADHIYVIPPDADISVSVGRLRLECRRGIRRPICRPIICSVLWLASWGKSHRHRAVRNRNRRSERAQGDQDLRRSHVRGGPILGQI